MDRRGGWSRAGDADVICYISKLQVGISFIFMYFFFLKISIFWLLSYKNMFPVYKSKYLNLKGNFSFPVFV